MNAHDFLIIVLGQFPLAIAYDCFINCPFLFPTNFTSGKRSHNYGKSTFLQGNLTNPVAIFNTEIRLPECIIEKTYRDSGEVSYKCGTPQIRESRRIIGRREDRLRVFYIDVRHPQDELICESILYMYDIICI